MNTSSKTTTKHEEIKKWVEERKGKPAVVRNTKNDGEGIGILRINFPGYAENNLEEISWEEFFDEFDKRKLAFLYQEEKSDGHESTFNKFVNRD